MILHRLVGWIRTNNIPVGSIEKRTTTITALGPQGRFLPPGGHESDRPKQDSAFRMQSALLAERLSHEHVCPSRQLSFSRKNQQQWTAFQGVRELIEAYQIHAALQTLSLVSLLAGSYMVKKHKIRPHHMFQYTALVLSTLAVSIMIYQSRGLPTVHGKLGFSIYLFTRSIDHDPSRSLHFRALVRLHLLVALRMRAEREAAKARLECAEDSFHVVRHFHLSHLVVSALDPDKPELPSFTGRRFGRSARWS